ncbi:MAG: iron chelate uptake ABC transporter family permease subunit [Candidatus Odinarchaeota archaeon]
MLFFVILPIEILITIIISALLAGFALSLVGTFVVHLKITTVGFCMSHAAFAGAALGLLLEAYGSPLDPVYMATIFAILIAFLLGPLSDKTKLDSNIILGIIFSLMIGLGFIFISLMPDGVTGSRSLAIIWGSLFGLTDQELIVLIVLNTSLIVIIIIFFKEFMSIMLNEKIALTAGINVRFFKFLILLATAIAVSFSINIVGAFLVYAMIVNPTSTVHQFVYDTKKLFIYSPIIGVLTILGGIFLSLWADFPISSSIIIFSSVIFALSAFFSPKRRKPKKTMVSMVFKKKNEYIRDFFDEHAESWDDYVTHDPAKLKKIISVLDLGDNFKVLDVGTGTGIMIPYLCDRLKKNGSIVALDISEKMISIAKEKYQKKFPNVEFIVKDVNNIASKEVFDAILCYSCFPHFVEQTLTIKKLVEALKKGGKLMIAHSQSRKEINNVHKNVKDIVSKDRLPPMKRLIAFMKKEELKIVKTLDNEEMFYILGEKQENSDKRRISTKDNPIKSNVKIKLTS